MSSNVCMAIVVAGYSIEGNVLGSPLNFSKAYVGPEIRYRTQLQIESELQSIIVSCRVIPYSLYENGSFASLTCTEAVEQLLTLPV